MLNLNLNFRQICLKTLFMAGGRCKYLPASQTLWPHPRVFCGWVWIWLVSCSCLLWKSHGSEQRQKREHFDQLRPCSLKWLSFFFFFFHLPASSGINWCHVCIFVPSFIKFIFLFYLLRMLSITNRWQIMNFIQLHSIQHVLPASTVLFSISW